MFASVPRGHDVGDLPDETEPDEAKTPMIGLHIGIILIVGVALLMMTILPHLLADRPLSLPLIYIAFGWVLFETFDPLPLIDPVSSSFDNSVLLYLTEAVVIISLATVGLSLERKVGWMSWQAVWRLLAIAMPLTVGAAILAGQALLGLGGAAALLLGAVLAPTDPVLADDVQVPGPGQEGDRGDIRFALTAEAGLNDSLAFPVVHLAIALSTASLTDSFTSWVSFDVLYRIVAALAVGFVAGKILVKIALHRSGPASTGLNTGLFIVGATLLTYGMTEVISGYGFLAVFVAALSRTDGGAFRAELHAFAEQVEALLVAVALISVGALLAAGVVDWTVTTILVATAFIFLVRPVAGWLCLAGSDIDGRDRWSIAFFGIRGMGSLFYLAYATAAGSFGQEELSVLWSATVLVILMSTVVHGITAPLVMSSTTGGPSLEARAQA